MMKIVVFGLGSMGKRHVQILQKYFHHELFAFRSGLTKGTNTLNIPEVYTKEELKKLKADVAFITNPTFAHISTALFCADLGMHLFIEKPLSSSLTGLVELEEICRMKNLTCYIAYCLRFHPVIEKIRELILDKELLHVRAVCSSYLPQWRQGIDHLESYSASADKGGGVLLDLSHEFDYIQHLFGPIMTMIGRFERVSQVTHDAEDFADILMETSDVACVNLHLNFLSLLNERKLTVAFKDGYLVGDLLLGRVDYHFNGEDKSFMLDSQRHEYLAKQTKYFFDNLGNEAIMNNLEESKLLLAKILEFKRGGK